MQPTVHPLPKLVIFDFDGTLADSGPWVASVLNDVAARYRFRTLSGAEMEALRGEDTRTILRRLAIPTWRLPFIARHVRARMGREIDEIRMFDGVAEMLWRLRAARVELAVASSNAEASVRRVLGPAGAAVGRFECGASLFGKAARFRRVLGWAGVRRMDALCVGDEVRDAEAAADAGIPFAAVAWGYNTAATLLRRNPAALFNTPAELAQLLAGPTQSR